MRSLSITFLSFLLGLLLLTHCGEPQSQPQAGGETHFMRDCLSDDDCGELSCLCGVCTETCASDGVCGQRSSGTTCSMNTCGSLTCTVECTEDASCSTLGKGLRCITGLCQASEDEDGSGGTSGSSMGGAPEQPREEPDDPAQLTCTEAGTLPALNYVTTGRLSVVQTLLSGDDFDSIEPGLMHLGISPDGRHVYVSGYYADELLIFARDPVAGTLTPVSSLGPTDGLGQYLDGPKRALFPDPNGELMLLPSSTGGRLGAWSRSPETGAVVPLGAIDFELNQWPNEAVKPKHSDYVFFTLAASGAETVAAARFDVSTASFGPAVVFDKTGIDAPTLESPERIVATSDGSDVYFVSINGETLHHMKFDPVASQWTYRAGFRDGEDDNELGFPSGLALSPDERHVYTAARNSSALSVYQRDCDSGELGLVESYTETNVATVAPSPDGENLYATQGGATPGVLAFARDPNTGRLSELNFVALDPEIAFLDDLIVSPDGRHVYISHLFPPTIVALERMGE